MKIAIPKRQTGTGNIYSLESDLYDREINFGDKYLYAVVLPAFYGGTGITRHKILDNALKAFSRNFQGARIVSVHKEIVCPWYIGKQFVVTMRDWEPMPEHWIFSDNLNTKP